MLFPRGSSGSVATFRVGPTAPAKWLASACAPPSTHLGRRVHRQEFAASATGGHYSASEPSTASIPSRGIVHPCAAESVAVRQCAGTFEEGMHHAVHPLTLALRAFKHVYRYLSCSGDMIAVLSETTGDAALQHMRKQMQATAEGREVLALQVWSAICRSRTFLWWSHGERTTHSRAPHLAPHSFSCV